MEIYILDIKSFYYGKTIFNVIKIDMKLGL